MAISQKLFIGKRRIRKMELTLPMNYVELEQDEMMYLDGGWSVTINRTTITAAFISAKSAYNTFNKINKLTKNQLASTIVKCGVSFAKGVLAAANFGSFLLVSLGAALAGVILATAGTIAAIWATNSSVTLSF